MYSIIISYNDMNKQQTVMPTASWDETVAVAEMWMQGTFVDVGEIDSVRTAIDCPVHGRSWAPNGSCEMCVDEAYSPEHLALLDLGKEFELTPRDIEALEAQLKIEPPSLEFPTSLLEVIDALTLDGDFSAHYVGCGEDHDPAKSLFIAGGGEGYGVSFEYEPRKDGRWRIDSWQPEDWVMWDLEAI